MYYYTATFIPNKIVIFGCGGTGSRLVPLVAQFLKTCSWVISPEIILIDPDIVEEKNLFRQNFIKPDIGKYKAEVLANRYSRAFNITIKPICEKLKISDKAQYDLINSTTSHNPDTQNVRLTNHTGVKQQCFSNTLFIMCVDSPEARREILNIIFSKLEVEREHKISTGASTHLLIDTGNETDYGQVYISSLRPVYTLPYIEGSDYNTPFDLNDYRGDSKLIPLMLNCEVKLPYLPFDVTYFSGLTEITKASCADLDQTMAINSLVANTAFSLVQQILYAKPIRYQILSIDLQHGSVPQYITTKTIVDSYKNWSAASCITSLENGYSPYVHNMNSVMGGDNNVLQREWTDGIRKHITIENERKEALERELQKNKEKEKENNEVQSDQNTDIEFIDTNRDKTIQAKKLKTKRMMVTATPI
jgi:hypothetical protein